MQDAKTRVRWQVKRGGLNLLIRVCKRETSICERGDLMTIRDFIILLIVAAVCGSLGMGLSGFSRGGLSGKYSARFHRRLDRYVARSCLVFAGTFHAGTRRSAVSDYLVDHRLRALCRRAQPLDACIHNRFEVVLRAATVVDRNPPEQGNERHWLRPPGHSLFPFERLGSPDVPNSHV
jgi:hypothetical protein